MRKKLVTSPKVIGGDQVSGGDTLCKLRGGKGKWAELGFQVHNEALSSSRSSLSVSFSDSLFLYFLSFSSLWVDSHLMSVTICVLVFVCVSATIYLINSLH